MPLAVYWNIRAKRATKVNIMLIDDLVAMQMKADDYVKSMEGLLTLRNQVDEWKDEVDKKQAIDK
jgi:hypothetical protein